MTITWFIYRDKLHSIEPKVELEMEITPRFLMMLADENMFLKDAEMTRGVTWKPFLDKKYGPDPEYLPIIISEERAQEYIRSSSTKAKIK